MLCGGAPEECDNWWDCMRDIESDSHTYALALCAETKDFETIASVCGLTRLLDLDLDSSRLCLEPGSPGASAPMTAAHPQHSEALALATSAAALQRLVVRCVLPCAVSIAMNPLPGLSVLLGIKIRHHLLGRRR